MPTIRVIQIHHKYVDASDISCLNVFADLLAHPTEARQLRGLMTFSFNRDGTDGVWAARPDVRRFVQAADRTYPFLPYFLLPSPEVKQVAYYVQCLFSSPMTQTRGGGYQQPVYPEEFLWLTYKKMHTLRRFAQRTGDREDEVVGAFIQALPALGDLTKQIQSLPLASLKDMFHEFFKGRDPEEGFEDAETRGAQAISYAQFKLAMDNEPFKGSTGDEMHVDVAVLKKLVESNPAMAHHWFDESLEIASTMPNPSMAKNLAGILLIVAGTLNECGDPDPLRIFQTRYGRARV